MSKLLNNFLNRNNILTLTLLFSDAFAVVLAFLASYFLRNKGIFRIFLDVVQPIAVYLQALPIAILILLIAFALIGLYEPKKRRTQISEMYTSFQTITVWILFIMAGSYLYKFDYSRIIVMLFYIFTVTFIVLGRILVRNLQTRLSFYGFGKVNILIVGVGKLAHEIKHRIESYKSVGFNFVGFVASKTSQKEKVLGTLLDLPKILKKYKIDEVYIADPSLSDEKILNLVAECFDTKAKFKITSNIFDLITGTIDMANLENIPSLDVGKIHFPWWKRIYKRTFDILFSGVSLIFTFPFWLVIMAAIKLDSKGSAILTQTRIGENGRLFKMYKFRTMRHGTSLYNEAPSYRNDGRVTKIGKLLRRFSLDELPQFVNILKGDMSVVGPRPEMPFVVKKYTYWERKRLEIKPGLTGLWQILGRKDLPLSENLEYDFYYINNQSFILDLVIILKTIPVILKGRGAY
ncbi:MAG: sugar transferase [Patescibacteria group bacterium]